MGQKQNDFSVRVRVENSDATCPTFRGALIQVKTGVTVTFI